ncbi:hypothetical protein J6S39_01835 [Candidatus Saccharibacteria bacterium]|nr:hypothetical protein [Candidatus Saccharibacteria bacterium]
MLRKHQKTTKPKPSVSKKPKRLPKKLKIALIVLLIAVVFGAIWAGVFFATKNIVDVASPATVDELYEKVQNYDYSNGHNEEIESDIKRLLEETDNENTRNSYAKTLKAKAEYYYGLQKYNTAVMALKELEYYAVSGEDLLYLYQHLADAYGKFGSSDLAAKYQLLYDDWTHKCGADADQDSDESSDQKTDQESAE